MDEKYIRRRVSQIYSQSWGGGMINKFTALIFQLLDEQRIQAMSTASPMQKDIYTLEKLSDVECGREEDPNHDYDKCPYCEVRQVLNEISEIAFNGVKSAKKNIVIDETIIL